MTRRQATKSFNTPGESRYSIGWLVEEARMGKTVIVTEASRGTGAAIARKADAAGYAAAVNVLTGAILRCAGVL